MSYSTPLQGKTNIIHTCDSLEMRDRVVPFITKSVSRLAILWLLPLNSEGQKIIIIALWKEFVSA